MSTINPGFGSCYSKIKPKIKTASLWLCQFVGTEKISSHFNPNGAENKYWSEPKACRTERQTFFDLGYI